MGAAGAESTPDHAAGLPGHDPIDLPELLKAAAGGDEGAWRTIVGLYARRVYALARSRLRGVGGSSRPRSGRSASGPWPEGDDTAEEVTQSVFCTVAAKLSGGEYTEQGRFESWLFRVAMNRIRDEVRRRRRQAEPTDPETFSERAGAGEDDVGRPTTDELAGLRIAMENLTEADREIVELRHHAGMSFKAMSEMLDEPIGTLLARHHRALRKLKELMGAEDSAPDERDDVQVDDQ